MQASVVKTVDGWLMNGLKSEQIQKIVRERAVKLSTSTTRVLYNKCYGGFGFSEDFMNIYGGTEDEDSYFYAEKHRSSKRAFETIELLGQDICTYAPYVCQDVELCQKLDLQTLGELIHTQRFREKRGSTVHDGEQYLLTLEKMKDWPTDVLEAARACYDTEGTKYWSLFIVSGGPFQLDSECTFTQHIKSKKTQWPLHAAFQVSGIAGGCLIAASIREKGQDLTAASLTLGQANESPYLIVGLAAASGDCCGLAYADVPDLADYKIHEHDGNESVVW